MRQRESPAGRAWSVPAMLVGLGAMGCDPAPWGAPEGFRHAVAVAAPSLVAIRTEAPAPRSADGAEGYLVEDGIGTGFVWSADGLILTNSHVVRGADAVSVELSDGRRADAEVVGRDPDTDVAVLRVPLDGLAPAKPGNSDAVRVGDGVLALGFPLGLSATVTAGIVSATGRRLGLFDQDVEAGAPLEHFLQTDAAINPGNSGGPLVDRQGRVVGITTAIMSPTGFYTGYGFAVPINLAVRVARDLTELGRVRRSAAGLRLAEVTPEDAEAYGLPAVAGAEVVGVAPGGPADQAGLALGDVIVAVDGEPVPTAVHARLLLSAGQPGERLRVRARRFDATVDRELTLARLDGSAASVPGPPVHLGPPRLGFHLDPDGRLEVREVVPFSPAMQAGLRPGQRILSANRLAVSTVAGFERALATRGPAAVLTLVVDDPLLGPTILNFRPEPRHQVAKP